MPAVAEAMLGTHATRVGLAELRRRQFVSGARRRPSPNRVRPLLRALLAPASPHLARVQQRQLQQPLALELHGPQRSLGRGARERARCLTAAKHRRRSPIQPALHKGTHALEPGSTKRLAPAGTACPPLLCRAAPASPARRPPRRSRRRRPAAARASRRRRCRCHSRRCRRPPRARPPVLAVGQGCLASARRPGHSRRVCCMAPGGGRRRQEASAARGAAQLFAAAPCRRLTTATTSYS